MSNPIEETEGIGRGPSRSNAIDQARAYSEMLAARRREAQAGPDEAPSDRNRANTSNNSTFTNSNDSLNANNVTSNQVAGAGGAGALIHAGRESGQSSSDNQGHNSGRNHQDSVVRSIANSRSELPTNVVSFFNDGPKPENAEARFSIHQRVAMANAMNRPSAANPEGQKLGGEAMNVIKNMDDADVQSGLEALRQAPGKASANNQMPNQGDSFTP